MSIQFFDCPNCGKSLRVGARQCHHCHAVDENDWADPDAVEEFAEGGYSDDEDDDPPPTAKDIWQRRIVVAIILLLLLSLVLQALLLI